MIKPWTESRGTILSTSLDIEKAEAIAALLTRPVSLLPRAEGDPIKPFAIGIWDDFRNLLIPNTSASLCDALSERISIQSVTCSLALSPMRFATR